MQCAAARRASGPTATDLQQVPLFAQLAERLSTAAGPAFLPASFFTPLLLVSFLLTGRYLPQAPEAVTLLASSRPTGRAKPRVKRAPLNATGPGGVSPMRVHVRLRHAGTGGLVWAVRVQKKPRMVA